MAHGDCRSCGESISGQPNCCEYAREEHARYDIRRWVEQEAMHIIKERGVLQKYINEVIKTKDFEFHKLKHLSVDTKVYEKVMVKMRYKLYGKRYKLYGKKDA